MELEYRITHSYVDKFSKPFERNLLRLEKFNRQVEKSVFLFERLESDKSFKLSLDSRSFSQEINAVKRELKKIETFELEGEQKLSITSVNWRNKVEPWKNKFKEPTIPKLNSSIEWKIPELTGSIEWERNFNQPVLETLKPEIEYTEAFRTSKKFSTKLHKLLKIALHIEPDLKTIFRNTRLTLHRLNREIERYEPTITLKMDKSAIQKQLEDIKKEISAQTFVSSISVGFGLNQLKEQLKEEGLSLSEALYESTKYGLRKAKLAYEIAQEVKRAGGYIDATEVGNNIVAALKQGVRGSERELAYFGTLMTKFQKAFDVSAEEIGNIIYSLQRFHLPSKDFESILGKAIALRREFNITSETMKEIMRDIDQNFGFLMSRLDRKSRAKFITGMEELAATLENSYIDSTKFMQTLAGAISGDVEAAKRALFLTGLNYRQIAEMLEKGDFESLGEALVRRAKFLYQTYGNLSPTAQAQVANYMGIDPKEFQQILQIGKNAEEFRENLRKAFAVKPVNPDEVIKESTNTLTRYTTVIKNKIIGLGGNLGEGFVDAFNSLFDLASSPLGAVATAWVTQRFGWKAVRWLGKKVLGQFGSKFLLRSIVKELENLGKFTASKATATGLQVGKGLLTGIWKALGNFGSKGFSILSKLPSLFSKVAAPLTVVSIVLEPEEVNVNEMELLEEWRRNHRKQRPLELPVKPQNQLSFNDVLKRQIQAESAGNPFAVSRAGAIGLAQFMPQTWKDVWKDRREFFEKYNPEMRRFQGIPDIYDPKAQLAAQKAYMSYLLDKFKDIRWALAAYNAGEGRIGKLYARFGGDFSKAFALLPKETQNYVRKILSTPKVKPINRVAKREPPRGAPPEKTFKAQPDNLTNRDTKENNEAEVTLLKEISQHLQSIQNLLLKAYTQKLLTPEGAKIPAIDPFEMWRKSP